ncbi:MAG: helicase-associated domain-containing protein [Desulfovibrio sp.]|nr:helicase-associated domain-containing protein [Desulfovibrio sp.]
MYNAAKNSTKDKVISILAAYYCAPNRFEQLWAGLNDAERRIISLHVWGDGSEPVRYADEVAEEFAIAGRREGFYYLYTRNGLDRFKERYAEKNSKLWLLFPKSKDNLLFLGDLYDAVGEMERVYTKGSDTLVFLTRENRLSEFGTIVRFCNSNKVSVTKSGSFSKSSALKLWNFCGYEEYTADINVKPEDIRTTQGLLVTFPLTVLCTISGLLAVTEGGCVPGGKAVSFLSLPHEQLVKKLFDAYIKSKNFDEISIMTGIKAKRGHHTFEARQNLVEELKYCPIGQPVYTHEFERFLRIDNYTFARKSESHVVGTGNGSYGYAAEWEEYEHPLIHIILSFFGALGILDIAWGENSDDYGDRGRRIPIAFRINPLGAYVLGSSDLYVAPAAPKTKIKGGFTVLPDYTIVVPDSEDRLKHEIYFEKLFTKVSTTDEAAIYKLDFGTIVRAVDSGVSIADLRNYLFASDRTMPENVVRALDDWEKQAGRIRLRQVTILECDEAALLEEVIHYRRMSGFIKEKILAAVVVDGNTTKEIKKIIEKNKRFCRDVL